ncbi:MAG: hypothetical protein ACKOQ3_04180 [Novosphingobium sp.]
MTARSLSREESLGLALALVGHAALVAWLVWQRAPAPLPMPERMSVTISDQTGPVSAAPVVQPEEAAPDKAPVLGEAPPPVPQPQVAPPQPQKPSPIAAPPKPPAKPAAPQTQTKPAKQVGGSDFNSAFGPGFANAKGKAKTPPASVASAQQVSSWTSLIGSRVRGPWNSCPVSGLDVQSLRAVVRFSLNRDGSIASIDEPQVTGITASNEPQVRPFRDCAVRAIKLAAPFAGLPEEFYDSWKLRRLTFSKRD